MLSDFISDESDIETMTLKHIETMTLKHIETMTLKQIVMLADADGFDIDEADANCIRGAARRGTLLWTSKRIRTADSNNLDTTKHVYKR